MAPDRGGVYNVEWSNTMSIHKSSYTITGGPHKKEIMKEEYVFPHNNWYLKFTEEERPIVDNWRINIIKYSNKPYPSNYINYEGSGGRGWRVGGCVLITIDQFKQYVLNIKEPIIEQQPEDLSYLIDIFKQLKIK